MPGLAELQARMRAMLLAVPDVVDDVLMAAVVPDSLPAGSPSSRDRLAVYKSNVQFALVEALRRTYPTVNWLAGAAFFDQNARIFLAGHPPGSAYLNDWGAGFGAWLMLDPNAGRFAYLGDVAQLDFAVSAAFHSRDAPRLSASVLLDMSPRDYPNLVLEPHASIHLLQLS